MAVAGAETVAVIERMRFVGLVGKDVVEDVVVVSHRAGCREGGRCERDAMLGVGVGHHEVMRQGRGRRVCEEAGQTKR